MFFNTAVNAGDTVTLKSSFGGGPLVTAIVVAYHSDIKNGFPGIDYTLTGSGDGHWAYMDQIKSIVSKS